MEIKKCWHFKIFFLQINNFHIFPRKIYHGGDTGEIFQLRNKNTGGCEVPATLRIIVTGIHCTTCCSFWNNFLLAEEREKRNWRDRKKRKKKKEWISNTGHTCIKLRIVTWPCNFLICRQIEVASIPSRSNLYSGPRVGTSVNTHGINKLINAALKHAYINKICTDIRQPLRGTFIGQMWSLLWLITTLNWLTRRIEIRVSIRYILFVSLG